MTITLTGFMGCGKSSVGKALAALLSCSFVDLDEYIETREGRSIPDIFKSEGEAGFRQIERDALGEVTACRPGGQDNCHHGPDAAGREEMLVLSLGGGTLTTPECLELVRARTLCIYLRASTDTLVSNLEKDFERRPMLNGFMKEENTGTSADTGKLRLRIEQLMGQRASIYENAAIHITDIDGKSIGDIAQEIACRLKDLSSKPENRKTGNTRRNTVWDPLRKKEIMLTPEEAVRQWCIRELLHGQMKVPMHMMMSETGFRLGDKLFRADILIYDREAGPLAVVECKRPETRLDRNVLEQTIRYNMALSVKYIIITNGTRTVILRKTREGYLPEQSAPEYEEMLK